MAPPPLLLPWWAAPRGTLAQLTVEVESSPSTEPSPVDQWLTEHSMLVGAVLAVVVVAVGIGVVAAAHHRDRRIRAMAPTAEAAGLRYSAGDLFGCTQVAFPLFLAGDGRTVEHVMWRTGANGLDLRVFDYAYYDEYKDKNGRVHRSWRYFNCAMARHNGLWPVIHVSRERALDKLGQRLGLADIELESEEFNRLFRVQCDDRRFATALLSPAMMELLLHTQGRLTFETKGRWLLVIAPRLDTPAEMVGLLGVADEFLRRIPRVVWELYGEGADTSGGQRTADAPPDPGLLPPLESVARVLRDEARDWRDPTPGVDYDLDGNPIPNRPEDPWG